MKDYLDRSFEGFERLNPAQEEYIENIMAEFEQSHPEEWDWRTFVPEINGYHLRGNNNFHSKATNSSINQERFEGFERLNPAQEEYIENIMAEFEQSHPEEWDWRTFVPEINGYHLRGNNNFHSKATNSSINQERFEGFERLNPAQEEYIENIMAEFEQSHPEEFDRMMFVPEINSYHLREQAIDIQPNIEKEDSDQNEVEDLTTSNYESNEGIHIETNEVNTFFRYFCNELFHWLGME